MSRAVELAPGLVLTGLVQRIDPECATGAVPNADALAALPVGRVP
jgi:hypothetical protein